MEAGRLRAADARVLAEALVQRRCPEHGEVVRLVPGEGEALGRMEGSREPARKLGQEALSQVLEKPLTF